MTRINTFDSEDWDKHVNLIDSFVKFSAELSDEVDGFARWHGLAQEQVIYHALLSWMKTH